jgi:hypothetical protein
VFRRQYQDRTPCRKQFGNPALRLLQQRFAPHDGAKLIWPIIACDAPREREQTRYLATG